MSERDERNNRESGPVIGVRIGSHDRGAGIVWGSIVVMVGVLVLLNNMGVLGIGNLFRFWPMLLIVAGLLNLRSQSGRTFGIILLLVGALFQLSAFGILHFTWGMMWAIVFIAAGCSIIWASIENRGRPRSSQDVNSANTMNAVAVFAGCERRIDSPDFQFGRVTAIFGGAELDFSHAAILGDSAELEVNAIFGGVEITVPDSWEVVSRGQFIFAGFSDKTRPMARPSVDNLRKKLIVSGMAVFGGVEVKS